MEMHCASAQLELGALGSHPHEATKARTYMDREAVARPERLARLFVPIRPGTTG